MKNVHAVYRLSSAGGELLYVGQSLNPFNRFVQHRHSNNAPLILDVTRMDVEWHATKGEAAIAELKAIREENPRYNIVGVDRRRRENRSR